MLPFTVYFFPFNQANSSVLPQFSLHTCSHYCAWPACLTAMTHSKELTLTRAFKIVYYWQDHKSSLLQQLIISHLCTQSVLNWNQTSGLLKLWVLWDTAHIIAVSTDNKCTSQWLVLCSFLMPSFKIIRDAFYDKSSVHIKHSRQQSSAIYGKHIEKVIQQNNRILYSGSITSRDSKSWWLYRQLKSCLWKLINPKYTFMEIHVFMTEQLHHLKHISCIQNTLRFNA